MKEKKINKKIQHYLNYKTYLPGPHCVKAAATSYDCH